MLQDQKKSVSLHKQFDGKEKKENLKIFQHNQHTFFNSMKAHNTTFITI